MIDFRYHMVSIVAVFLALATGLVIGATSLQGQVAGTLQGQVTQLRQDKQTLRSELDHSTQGGQRHDQFITDAAPELLSGQLARRTVAVVALPGTSGGLIRRTQQSLRQSGATVTSTVELDDTWVEGDGAQRTTLLDSAAREQGSDPSSVPANRLAGLVLAEAITAKEGQPASAQGETPGLQRLADGGLLRVSPEDPQRAQAIVILWPARKADGGSELRGWTDLVIALGLSGRPVVGVASGPADVASATPDALVSALRDSAEATGAMSTVDDGDRPVGQIAAMLALREEFGGQSGHYGLDKDAAAVAPPLKAP